MTQPTLTGRGARVAMLAAIAALVVGALPVRAASSVEIEARALIGGRYEVGGWLAVAVTLANEGEPTEGYVVSQTDAGTARRFVEMPAGARKVVMLYVQPEAFQRQLTVSYDEPNGRVDATVQVSVLQQSNDQVAVIGDAAGNLRPQLVGGDQVIEAPDPIVLGPADIPERPEPLDGLSAIVWAADSGSLNEAQRRALDRWIGDGGQLVVVAGGDWQARTAAFAELLPLENLAGVDGVRQEALASWSGETEAPVPTATVATGDLRDGARALVTAESGEIVASMRSIGAGRVVLIGPDMATEDFRGWAGSPRLWSRLLPTNALFEQFFGGGVPIRQEMESAMTGALGTIPALDVPPAELLLVVIVGYILLIGPVSYLVLRRVDRRELAWVTAPILVILFSACSYGIGRTMKGSDLIVNQISVLRSSSAGGSASVETYAGLFSPERGAFDLSVATDALISRVASPEFATGAVELIEQGDPATLHDLRIGSAGFQIVRADAILPYAPALEVSWRRDDGELIGTVTNTGEEAMEDVAYVSASGGEMIGDIEPGQRVDFTVGRNFNGTSASDQVYGFGRFDASDPDQREIAMRRQVIDGLVGYGGGLPRGVADGPAVGERGPFVIGWRSVEGPMPVSVDGLDTRRFAQSVEVISTRATLGPGRVTLGPEHMAVAVTATDGDATPGGNGLMFLGTGTITYSIALPLEATGMRVDELELILGPDANVVVGDPGGFGAFLPEGFRIEYRDVVTGEWTLVAELEDRTRIAIDEPARAVNDAGRMELRLIGQLVDETLGPTGIFLGVAAGGEIPE